MNPLNQFLPEGLLIPYLLWNLILITLIIILINKSSLKAIGEIRLSFSPLINSIFILVLINNLIGLIPYSFTTTSHFSLTLSLSLTIIGGITYKHLQNVNFSLIKWILGFTPSVNLPKPLLILITFIEILSYFMRIFSLAIRLSANLISGHILLYIISYFSIISYLVLPLYLLEIAISFIQSFVFVLLISTYQNNH